MKILFNIALFLFYALLSGAGLVTIKIAVSRAPLTIGNLIKTVTQPLFLVGFICYGGGFLVSLFILSKFKLYIAYPVSASLFFIVVISASFFVLKEQFSLFNMLGILLCLIGIIMINVR